jgi:uncharacterized protein (DUF2252 family)
VTVKDILASTDAYEAWLARALDGDVVADDLATKRERMAAGTFPFLRATYWRWAETMPAILDLPDLPEVLSIGDAHLENFGTWRDEEGRLVWGANDFDDAAVMPYPLDLIRLGVSAKLAADGAPSTGHICHALWKGYCAGLADPAPIVLERGRRWLRETILLSEDERTGWWRKFDRDDEGAAVPDAVRDALQAAMPGDAPPATVFPRGAGLGSLGKPRFVGRSEWRGGTVLREYKAILPSVWAVFARGGDHAAIRAGEIATGAFRAPDPHYRVENGRVVRRLAPSNRKIEVDDAGPILLAPEMLALMGREIANCHAGARDQAALAAIRADVTDRDAEWLADLVRKAAKAVKKDQQAFAEGKPHR